MLREGEKVSKHVTWYLTATETIRFIRDGQRKKSCSISIIAVVPINIPGVVGVVVVALKVMLVLMFKLTKLTIITGASRN